MFALASQGIVLLPGACQGSSTGAARDCSSSRCSIHSLAVFAEQQVSHGHAVLWTNMSQPVSHGDSLL